MIEATPAVEKVWKANKGKQETFIALPDSIFEAFYGGAAGGGKSESLLMLPVVRQFTDNRNFQGLLLRRIYRELEEVIERSRKGQINPDGTEIPSFYELGADWNESKKRWKFASGATFTFGHAEAEEDVRKYDTSQFQYIAFDELTSFTQFQYEFLAFSRCRSIDPSLPAIVRSASNPGNIGHGWVRKRFVEPYPNGGRILLEHIGNEVMKRIFIQAFLTDNPKLMDNDPMYKLRLEMLPEAERRAKLLGDWWTFSGQVFDEWRIEPFKDEPENARHVLESQTFPDYLPRVLALDWGFKALTYALFGVAFPNRRGVAYREFATQREGVESWTTKIANICMEEGINPLIALDPSAWQHRDELSIQEQFERTWRKVTGKVPRLIKANNDRLAGKMLAHDYLRWKPRPRFFEISQEQYDKERADWILRNKGLQAYKDYHALFAPPPGDQIDEVLPKFLTTKDCPLLIKTIPLCVYNTTGKNLEDVAEFEGDDPYDCWRYFLFALERLFNAAGKAEEYELEQAKIAEQASTLDPNTFYRRMEILEAKTKKKLPFIQLRRRRNRHVQYN